MAGDNGISPSFLVKFDGTRLELEKSNTIKEIVVNDSVDSPSSFSILASDSDGLWGEDTEIGTEVSISLGHTDDVAEVLKGEITGLSTRILESGGRDFVIKGHSKLHRLVRAKKTQAFTEMSPSDIVEQLASDASLQTDVDSLGSASVFLMQRNMTDYDMVMAIAKKYNCNVWVEENKLCCKVVAAGGQEEAVLEWGKTLISFQVELDTSGLVTEVEVRGWDAETLEPIVGSKTHSDISTKIDGSDVGAKLVNDSFSAHKTVVMDDSVPDQATADQLALDLITENSFNYIIGKAKTAGNYDLSANKMVSLQGIGDRFSGLYAIKNARHFLSVNSGYTTYLTLVRNAL